MLFDSKKLLYALSLIIFFLIPSPSTEAMSSDEELSSDGGGGDKRFPSSTPRPKKGDTPCSSKSSISTSSASSSRAPSLVTPPEQNPFLWQIEQQYADIIATFNSLAEKELGDLAEVLTGNRKFFKLISSTTELQSIRVPLRKILTNFMKEDIKKSRTKKENIRKKISKLSTPQLITRIKLNLGLKALDILENKEQKAKIYALDTLSFLQKFFDKLSAEYYNRKGQNISNKDIKDFFLIDLKEKTSKLQEEKRIIQHKLAPDDELRNIWQEYNQAFTNNDVLKMQRTWALYSYYYRKATESSEVKKLSQKLSNAKQHIETHYTKVYPHPDTSLLMYGSKNPNKVAVLDLAYHLGILEYLGRKWLEPKRPINRRYGYQTANILIPRLCFIISDRPHQKNGDHRRIILPINREWNFPSYDSPRQHSESRLLTTLNDEDEVDYIVDLFIEALKQRLNLDDSKEIGPFKVYSVALLLYSTWAICDNCVPRLIRLQDSYEEDKFLGLLINKLINPGQECNITFKIRGQGNEDKINIKKIKQKFKLHTIVSSGQNYGQQSIDLSDQKNNLQKDYSNPKAKLILERNTINLHYRQPSKDGEERKIDKELEGSTKNTKSQAKSEKGKKNGKSKKDKEENVKRKDKIGEDKEVGKVIASPYFYEFNAANFDRQLLPTDKVALFASQDNFPASFFISGYQCISNHTLETSWKGLSESLPSTTNVTSSARDRFERVASELEEKNKEAKKGKGSKKSPSSEEEEKKETHTEGQRFSKAGFIPGDGSCMYRAALRGARKSKEKRKLSKKEENATIAKLRNDVAKQLKKNFQPLLPQIINLIGDGDLRGLGESELHFRIAHLARERKKRIRNGKNPDTVDTDIQNSLTSRVEGEATVFELYIEGVRNGDVWGGNAELEILRRLLDVEIIVHMADGSGNTITINESNDNVVHLSYDGAHYELLVPLPDEAGPSLIPSSPAPPSRNLRQQAISDIASSSSRSLSSTFKRSKG